MEKEKLEKIYREEIINAYVDENDDRIEERYKLLYSVNVPMYDLVLGYSRYYNERRDYGGSVELTMIEVHVLTMIEETKDITVTEIATRVNRTVAMISQIVRRLIEFGLIEKTRSKEIGTVYHLSTTESGKEMVRCHKIYDNIGTIKTRKKLLKQFSVEELIAFDRVAEAMTNLLIEEKKKRLKEKSVGE